MGSNPYGLSAIVSGNVKLVLLALVALHAVPLSNDQIAAIALAVSGLVDTGLYVGLIRPKINAQSATPEAPRQAPPTQPAVVPAPVAAPPVLSATSNPTVTADPAPTA